MKSLCDGYNTAASSLVSFNRDGIKMVDITVLIKVIFIIVISVYFGVIRLIYLDIKSMNISKPIPGFHPILSLLINGTCWGLRLKNYTLDRSVTIGRCR